MVSAPEPVPASSTARAGEDVSVGDDGSDVLRVYDGGDARHDPNVVGHAGLDDDQRVTLRCPDADSLRLADDVVVMEGAEVVLVVLVDLERDEVAPTTPVEDEGLVTLVEDVSRVCGHGGGTLLRVRAHRLASEPHTLRLHGASPASRLGGRTSEFSMTPMYLRMYLHTE